MISDAMTIELARPIQSCVDTGLMIYSIKYWPTAFNHVLENGSRDEIP